MSRRIVAVSAGVGVPSSTRLLTDQILAAVRTQVAARGESVDVEVVELRELATDLAAAVNTGGLASPSLAGALAQVSSADGLVAVTPVFSASYSGLFKLFFDVVDPQALVGTPVLVAATGGTPRHSLVLDHALRPLFSYFRAVVVPTGVFAATDDFGDGAGGASLSARVAQAAAELAGLVVTVPSAVRGFTPTPEDRAGRHDDSLSPEHVTPFAQLLDGYPG
ncbi:MAG TPA: FMN reductase [Nocardioides sp.]|uniref:FMN reductase n=1 Tax=Nocardioides sp. TaxID=35761 RepID=UPI002C037350|nr:FMN reductase [Nocardioides sp.]HQR27374.1 FMN reductase [Nocardioides sp.]